MGDGCGKSSVDLCQQRLTTSARVGGGPGSPSGRRVAGLCVCCLRSGMPPLGLGLWQQRSRAHSPTPGTPPFPSERSWQPRAPGT